MACVGFRQAVDRAKLATYFAWCDFGAWLRRPAYLFFDFSAAATCTFMRFRLGSHDLAVEVGRWQDRRPRCQRLCERCSMHVVDDEQHLVFECPAFSSARAIRPHLFSGVPHDMNCFLRQQDQQGVFWFILDCLREAKELAGLDRSADVDVGMHVEVDTYDSD